MKISYRREMKHNYLIVDPEELAWKNYECSMLAENSIEGVLRFQLRQIDDEIRFYYEITSRQPLSRLLENQAVRTEEIRRLVLGISAVLDRMEQYLLREGCILLEPDYIYVEPESFRVWLCLVPGLERDFPEDYGKWLEYLLGKVDHQDKESVVLAYGLYQETRKENYGMEDILRLLGINGGGESRKEQKEEGDGEQEFEGMESGRRLSESRKQFGKKERGQRNEESENGSGLGQERRKAVQQSCLGQEPGASSEKPGLWERFRQWLSRRKEPADDDPIRVPLEMLFREEEDPGERERTADGRETQRQPAGYKMSEQYTAQHRSSGTSCERDTILLADMSKAAVTELRCLRALDKGMEDIVIPYFPFIIGKQENLADYLLRYDTVSRLHVRIDQEGEGWKIQDLNSTNGTAVDGKLLENNESAEVHIGDEVRIAEFRFRFE